MKRKIVMIGIALTLLLVAVMVAPLLPVSAGLVGEAPVLTSLVAGNVADLAPVSALVPGGVATGTSIVASITSSVPLADIAPMPVAGPNANATIPLVALGTFLTISAVTLRRHSRTVILFLRRLSDSRVSKGTVMGGGANRCVYPAGC